MHGFSALNAVLTDDRGYALSKKYGVVFDDEAIIEMITDLDNLTLGYIINEIDYGKAFAIVQSEYSYTEQLSICIVLDQP